MKQHLFLKKQRLCLWQTSRNQEKKLPVTHIILGTKRRLKLTDRICLLRKLPHRFLQLFLLYYIQDVQVVVNKQNNNL